MTDQILVNGQHTQQLSVLDRGLAYGDGVFETIKISAGKPVFWTAHLARLEAGCARLALPFTAALAALLKDEAKALLAQSAEPDAVLKIILTRGASGRGYRPDAKAQPTRILSLNPQPQYPADNAEGVAVTLCETQLSSNPHLAGIKHLNRLEQVLARAEWDDEFAEGLVCDSFGYVVEGTCSNLFLVQNGKLLTPVLTQAGVAGVMRQQVIELVQSAGIECVEGPFKPDAVFTAEGAFLTNSLIGVWPIKLMQNKAIPISPLISSIQSWVDQAEHASLKSFQW